MLSFSSQRFLFINPELAQLSLTPNSSSTPLPLPPVPPLKLPELMHDMDDEVLLSRASMVPMVNEFPFKEFRRWLSGS
ncbi:hypothetical protein Nepgr_003755 [Nepenthes gracilis]|uniref:Uncharacterized protein n=1 Tax=Nepenthes gracilis TaxID=150966 RepID=A0AAD3S039_NEPGR|nr:hypothetical protein Nepgr_003755 [Nepenthes gracilis]